MWETFKNAWKIQELRKKMLFTLLMLLIFRLGVFLPVPGVDSAAFSETISSGGGILGFYNILTGGAFSNFTVFAMGITPYINASIIIQLLTMAIPALERLAKEGEEGRKKINNITRYAAIGFAFLQSIGITIGMTKSYLLYPNFWSYVVIAATLTAGTAFLMWLADRIDEKGIGNGISLLIFAGIISQVPVAIISLYQMSFVTGEMSGWWLLPLLIGFLAIIVGVIFVELGQRKIPVQYAKKVVGRKMYGGQATNIPMKVNASGVMPIIFAMSLLSMPQLIAQFIPNSGFGQWINTYFTSSSWLYAILYALLIVGFAYFYATVSFNPVEISNQLKQNGGFILGIRPGRPTVDYLMKISMRLTLVGALFLMIVAIIPIVLTACTGIPMYFGGTAVLIMVSVAMETSRELESQMLMRHYKGFLK